MITRLFLDRLRLPDPMERACVVEPLARAYFSDRLSDLSRQEIGWGLGAILDDASPIVRRRLAEVLAGEPRAPHHIVLALARQNLEVAEPVLALSPVLRDFDLVDLAAEGDDAARAVIAARAGLSAAVAAAIVEVSGPGPCIALLDNPAAAIMPMTIARLAERHEASAEVRAALFQRPDLPLPVRHALTAALCDALGDLGVVRAFMRPERARSVIHEAWEKVTVDMTMRCTPEEQEALLAHLAATGELTGALLLRALSCGNVALFERALAQLAGVPARRASRLVRDGDSAAFRALFDRAGLPEGAYDGFRVTLANVLAAQQAGADLTNAGARRCVLERILTVYQDFAEGDLDTLFALLSGFADEASREEARQVFWQDAEAA